jgi:4-amino-4-deoxy-L-arabinose transferase-like glycosyltransferase
MGTIVTALNLTKAVHIDDTAYLEVAQHIQDDPLHPMAGQVNWIHESEPIHRINQPHLWFYLLALCMAVSGDQEITFHLLMALFSLGCILLFYLLARHWAQRHALLLTALFCLGPAFLPGQNLMCDVPMLCLWLLFFWALIRGHPSQRAVGWYALADVAAAAACLIKYTSVVLLPILVIDVAWQRRWRALLALLIPLGALAAWSAFNYYDYGGIHILERSPATLREEGLRRRMISWLIGLGAVAPFAVMYLPRLWERPRGRLLLAGCLMVGVLRGSREREPAERAEGVELGALGLAMVQPDRRDAAV